MYGPGARYIMTNRIGCNVSRLGATAAAASVLLSGSTKDAAGYTLGWINV